MLLLAFLAALDVLLRAFVPALPVWQRPVDIQSPEMLAVKLDELRRFEGKKIVVLGDSLVFGRTMRDHGDKDWAKNTMPSQLEAALNKDNPDTPVKVLNLGMNGVVPADLDHLIRIVLPLKPDLILFDLSLRSFSRDFEKGPDVMARPWLKTFEIAPDGRYRAGASHWQDIIVNAWYLNRIRDTVQALVFDGQPVAYLTRLRDKWDARLKGKPVATEDEFMLILKARARYDRIDLADDNPQKQALDSVLARLRASGQPALGFYATEDNERLEDLIERPKFAALQRQLGSIMAGKDDTIEWLGPLKLYKPSDYLDHVHLNEEGYARLTEKLLPLAKAALATKTEVLP